MANVADCREAIADWFNVPVGEVDHWLSRITPTIDLEALVALAAEKGGVAGPRDAVHTVVTAAVGAALGRVQLMNPPGSGMIIRIHKVVAGKATTGLIPMGFVNTALASAGRNRYLDQRIGITPDFVVKHPAGSLTHDTNAATGIAAADLLWRATIRGNTEERYPWHGRLVLSPGFGFRCCSETVNEAVRIAIFTTEIPARLA